MDDPDFSGSSLKAGIRGGECKTKQESSHRENTRIEQLFLFTSDLHCDRDDNIGSLSEDRRRTYYWYQFSSSITRFVHQASHHI